MVHAYRAKHTECTLNVYKVFFFLPHMQTTVHGCINSGSCRMARNYEGRQNSATNSGVSKGSSSPSKRCQVFCARRLEGVKSKENLSSEEDKIMWFAAFLFIYQQWTIYLYFQSRVIWHHIKSSSLTVWPDNTKTPISTKRTRREEWRVAV